MKGGISVKSLTSHSSLIIINKPFGLVALEKNI
jgi:hypothetical protein